MRFGLLIVLLCAQSAFGDGQPIRFGATLTLTSASAPFAKACQRGIELAVADVNAGGGIAGRTLEVLFDDFHEDDLKRAAAAAQKFAAVDKVVALLPNWSEDAEVVGPIAERHSIISMALAAGGPMASRFSSVAFRATSSDTELAVASVRYERAHGAQRMCLITAPTSYYEEIARDIKQEWTTSGGSISLSETLPYGSSDTKGLVTKTRGANCHSIFIWASPGTISAFTAELRRQKVAARRVYPWFADTPEVLALTKGDTNSYLINRWLFDDEAFKERYRRAFAEPFMRPAGNCYDGVRVLATVMNRVGTDSTRVREALLQLRDYRGVTGPFIVRPDRERTGERSEALLIKDGTLVPILPSL